MVARAMMSLRVEAVGMDAEMAVMPKSMAMIVWAGSAITEKWRKRMSGRRK